ncbi:hypothetical protein KBP46_09890 [Chryseobacterium sp. PCH239]|uniref:hypothetical protein n=1 Tax=Chryseobacterium sp. PCH239 TaxID=2825845 RepID=UPI001C123E87|nr:hypothetical protein [Chryseobacterium sp. PCH239]QWT88106.1 hypothetical protein KBP46_09890 [Chryseobacterium sp. PCH239]
MDQKAESNLAKFTAKFVEIYNRIIPQKKECDFDIYLNDVDNLYPDRLEAIERNSVTAISCSNKLGNFIFGKGFENNFASEINTRNNQKITLNRCLLDVSNSLKTHKGVYIHLNFNIEGKVNYFDVLEYKKCRKVKEDDYGNEGVIVYKDWSKQKRNFSFFNEKKNKRSKWFYPYNPENINAQREKDSPKADIKTQIVNYRGQVLYYSLDDRNQIYANGWLNAQGMNDADSEFRMSLYHNNNIRLGFIDKTILITNGLDPDSETQFQKDFYGWLGAENAGGVYHINTPYQVEDIKSTISVETVASSYDPKKFKEVLEDIKDNIRSCYLQIPKILIDDKDGGIFGNSGEAIKEATKVYNNETASIRYEVEDLFKKIFNTEFKIIPIIQEDVSTDVGDELRLKSQAELKGSVGGVSALIELQKSVSEGFTERESAIEIIKEIYGISADLAEKMIGQPKDKTDDNMQPGG